MAVRIGHASIDENGKAKNGTAGDQTGREVCIRNWYLNNKGWVVLRCNDAEKRERIAKAMEKACNNPRIGYDQNQRNTLFNNVKSYGFDPSKTTKNVETDCSALVRVCVAYAYGEDITGGFNTTTEPATLVKTGQFTKYTADEYCKSSNRLLRGDILCTPVKGHTVVVLDNGATPVEEVCNVKVSILKKGSRGNNVKALQALLIGYGYDCGRSGVDGDFGTATDSAVRKYQSRNNLDVDGSVGPKTWAKLLGNT